MSGDNTNQQAVAEEMKKKNIYFSNFSMLSEYSVGPLSRSPGIHEYA